MPIQLENLRVCKTDVPLKPLESVVGDEALPFVRDWKRLILKTPAELEAETPIEIVPIHRPRAN